MVQTGTADWLGRQFILGAGRVGSEPLALLTCLIIGTAVVHLAITNLAACIVVDSVIM